MAAPDPGKVCRFCVVGTSVITENLINAGEEVDGFKLVAIYSRTEESAKKLADKFPQYEGKLKIFVDFTEMAKCEEIDAVYIASPTSSHAEHSITCMSSPHPKHVLCEKPIASNSEELDRMLKCATEHKVALMEGMRCLKSPNFEIFRQAIKERGQVRHFSGTACQFSSKYPAYLRGERPNAFDPKLSNGALMDIGCYAVHTAVAILGTPKKVNYTALKLQTGVDGAGTLVLEYEDMIATMLISKMSQGFTRTEVQTEEGTVSIDSTLEFTDVKAHSTKEGDKLLSTLDTAPSDKGVRGACRWSSQMTHELRAFVELFRSGQCEDSVLSWQQSRDVMKVLDDARRSADIKFPADAETGYLEMLRGSLGGYFGGQSVAETSDTKTTCRDASGEKD
jgi:predicted dehydrogenase